MEKLNKHFGQANIFESISLKFSSLCPSLGCVCGCSSVGQKELDMAHTPSFFLSWFSSSVGVGMREKGVDAVLSQLLVEKVALLILIACDFFPFGSKFTGILKGAVDPSFWLPVFHCLSLEVLDFSF